VVLQFLAAANVHALQPAGVEVRESGGDDDDDDDPDGNDDDAETVADDTEEGADSATVGTILTCTYPAQQPERKTLPVRLKAGDREIDLSHWAETDSMRDHFRLFAGQQSSCRIVQDMLVGKRPLQGARQLWQRDAAALLSAPFDVVTPLPGRFNLDARGDWDAIDVGYSPDKQKHKLVSSPVVEILAAWGLSHVRPKEVGVRKYRYGCWEVPLPPLLARTVLDTSLPAFTARTFAFDLALISKKYKRVKFAREET
jgi:CRISPR-associated protein Csb3